MGDTWLGSYMIYAKHRAGPPPGAFEAVRLVTPNISGRMDNLRAAILRPQQEKFVASSYQFLLLDWSGDAIRDMVARCLARGVELKWFGAVEPVGFTSRHDSWTYAPSSPMPSSDRVLHSIIDMRLLLTFSLEDCVMVARIIGEEVTLAFAASW